MSDLINELLKRRHAKDVLVFECKDGPTQTGSHLRMDAWAMSRSWSHLLFSGYEVKRSRADFLRDDKWHGYLPYCNDFWFVASKPGLIEPSELPAEVGLLVPTSTGSALVTKKKAVRRAVDLPAMLLCYVLMCRSKIVSGSEVYNAGPPNIDLWRDWLAEKEDKREIGHRCSRGLKMLYERDVLKVQEENRILKSQIQRADEVLAAAKELGVGQWFGDRDLCKKIKEAVTPSAGLTVEQTTKLQSAIFSLNQILDASRQRSFPPV